jgi:putative ABC transport system ATP-binding protein
MPYRHTPDLKTDTAILVMKDLCKTYHLGSVELRVLKDVNLTIHSGEYVAVMGPSGSGKSTLLNMIGCLDRPTTGNYLLGGKKVATLEDVSCPSSAARIRFVFQSQRSRSEVVENIEIPMYYQGFSEQASAQRARDLATLVGLGERLNHRPTELSGGPAAGGHCRAMANDPLIILADEPTGNLDSASGADILAILDRLHAQGKTLIVVTHDESIAVKAQRVIRLFDGRIAKDEFNGQ